MPIEVIDLLKQKNNGSFPLIEAKDVKGGFHQVNNIEERNVIPKEKRIEGMYCYVLNDTIYRLLGGIENSNWIAWNVATKQYVDNQIDSVDTLLEGKADTSHVHGWSELTGKPSTFTPTLGITSSTAFRGDQGLIAYNHSQVAHAPANAEQNVQADWNESNTSSDAYIKNKPTIPIIDVNKAYVDGELNKKADKTSLHNHNNKEVLDTIDTLKITQWDKAIIFEESQTDDANTWLTTGYTKTKDSTTNLPLQCDTSTDRWGILQFVSENADLSTGSQLFFPIDGKYKGRIFVRSITNRQPGQWTLLSTFSGSYNDLTEKPTIPVVDVTKSYVDEKLSGKADTNHIHEEYANAMHNHVNKDTLDTITQANIDKWNSSLNLTEMEVYGGNVDTKTTPGYYLTNGYNTGLPPECNDWWNRNGLLYVISANKDDGKCIQTYYPLDGYTNGNVYWRAVFPGDIKEWKKASNFSGSYNDLTDKPQIPTPEQIQSWDSKVDKSELNNYTTKSELSGMLNNHKFWSGTQQEYDAITFKDSNTVYFIKEG